MQVESIILYFFWLYSMLNAVLLISRFSHHRGFLGILFLTFCCWMVPFLQIFRLRYQKVTFSLRGRLLDR